MDKVISRDTPAEVLWIRYIAGYSRGSIMDKVYRGSSSVVEQ
ncbi:MAG: hypothetical protein PHC71_05360 [Candidatus Omnitrophica bacterium]|nr:hypothetical protein [Candidatus Omnitrophota bacterium]